MRYDKKWLQEVKETRKLIPQVKELIERVPYPDRPILMEQLNILSSRFESNFGAGRFIDQETGNLYDLWSLAYELAAESAREGLPADSPSQV